MAVTAESSYSVLVKNKNPGVDGRFVVKRWWWYYIKTTARHEGRDILLSLSSSVYWISDFPGKGTSV